MRIIKIFRIVKRAHTTKLHSNRDCKSDEWTFIQITFISWGNIITRGV